MKLYKYQSTGNDFLCVIGPIDQANHLAKKVCDRHFGVGADGLLIAEKTEQADIQMTYYNSDGTIAPMCGNGLRAFADFVYRNQLVHKKVFNVKTDAGTLAVEIKDAFNIMISLNQPEFSLAQPNVVRNISQLEPIKIRIDTQDIIVYVLMLGTLHGIVFVEDITQIDVITLGGKLCHHAFFPNHININFVQVVDQNHLFVQTFERGAGPTLSCGTGVAASAVVTHHLEYTKSHVYVEVPGGHLEVHIKDQVMLQGPTQYVALIEYQGDIL